MKYFTHLTVFILLLLLTYCTEPAESLQPNETMLAGSLHPGLNKLEGKKLYLYSSDKMNLPGDSVIVTDGKFAFKIDTLNQSVPFRAKIYYPDTVRDTKIIKMPPGQNYLAYLRPLAIINPYDSNSIESLFYVDIGKNVIVPNEQSKNQYKTHVFQSESKQNEPYYRHIQISAGKDSVIRKHTLVRNSQLIRQYPNSLYLLEQLFANRDHIDSGDLKSILKLFGPTVIRAVDFKKFEAYFRFIADTATTVAANLTLDNETGRAQAMFAKDKRVKLLIFWASWCAPCRAEIPELKQLYTEINKVKLDFVGVSIDDNIDSWKAAIHKEKMPWKQLVINERTKNEIYIRYGISSIPLMFILDSENNIVQRIEGSKETTIRNLRRQVLLMAGNK